ncbi:hypothetical protein WM40_27000 [Robbsia andropogonis]|uniref:DUF1640 domain-containing protein n=1 Tax=Robbsia andropogonis TaxID=28092 RepID=A0A0F5JTZ0_9BURK|nr:hypothetical protein [Robbsia andropogonis]KKB60817.1 hypothetical protein WM40_27000 [Robbsia andropogonis]
MSHVDIYELLMKVGLSHDETRDFISALNEGIEMRLENQLNAFRATIAEQHASFRVHMAERDNMIFGKLAEMSGDIHGIKAELKSIDSRFDSMDKRINALTTIIGLAFAGTSTIVALSHFIK